MRTFKWKKRRLARAVMSCLLLQCLAACSTPDHWYDLEQVYDSKISSESGKPVEEELLPQTQWKESASLPVAEDGGIALSLEQAVFLALKRNREMGVERYAPLVAGTFEQVERGVYDTEFFSALSYGVEDSSDSSLTSTEEGFDLEEDSVTAVLGLRQQLPTGTEVEAILDYDRTDDSDDEEQQDVRFGLTITQSLLRGFGAAVNLVSIRQAQLAAEASFYEFRGFVEALLSEVEIAYWRYVLETEGLSILEQSLAIAEKQLREVESRIEVGVIPRNSVAAARAEVARREQALLEGKSRRIERRLRLLRLLNVTENRHFELNVAPTSQPRMEAEPIENLEERLELALLQRPDLAQARLAEKQQRLEVVRTKNGLLPRLDLFIDLGKSGYARTFSRSWSNLDEDDYDLQLGLEFSSYLGNRTAKGEYLAARASRDQATAAIENLENMVLLDVRLAANEVERTRQQINASRITREMEAQTVKAEEERFSVGDTTSLLVAQAQRDLLVSRLAEVEAIVEYRIALVNLYLAEGSLLERRGIGLGSEVE